MGTHSCPDCDAREAEVKRLREALEFYASQINGPYHNAKGGNFASIDNDAGKVARQALAEMERG